MGFYYDKIKETYNLEELAIRPVLIELITESLPQLIKRKKEINAGKLYEVYTDFWLDRDIKSERTFMQKEDKRLFVQELAFKMFLEYGLLIHYAEFPQTVKEHFGLKNAEEIDYFEHDIRTCSYFSRDTEGHYKFAHKSFMEFFVAKKLAEELRKKNTSDFGKTRLTSEIINFMYDLLDNDEDADKICNVVSRYKETVDARVNSVNLLYHFQNEKAFKAISLVLKRDIDSVVRSIAAQALGQIGNSSAVSPLCEALRVDKNEVVCQSVLDSLVKLNSASVEPLCDVLRVDKNSEVRKLAADGLGRIGDLEAIVPLCEALRKEESKEIRSVVENAIIKFGATAIDPLCEVLKTEELDKVRFKVVQILIKLGNPAVPQFCKIILEEKDAKLRSSIAYILGDIGNIASIDPLYEVLISDEDSEVLHEVGNALVKLGPESIEPLCKTFKKDLNNQVWVIAKKSLIELGNPSVKPLCKILRESKNTEVLDIISDGLVKLGKGSVQPLCQIMSESTNAEVRNIAADALVQLKKSSAQSLSEILSTHKNNEVRALAAYALGRIRDINTLGHLNNALYYDKDKDVRRNAVYALSEIDKSSDLSICDALEQDESSDVRLAAAQVLQKIGTKHSLPTLRKAQKDENQKVRAAVVKAIRKIEKQN